LLSKKEEFDSTTSRLNRQLSDIEFARSSQERHKSTLESELTASQHKVAGLKSTVAQMSVAQAGNETKVSLAACQARCADKEDKMPECEATIAAKLSEIDAAKQRYAMMRRCVANFIIPSWH